MGQSSDHELDTLNDPCFYKIKSDRDKDTNTKT